MTELKDRDIYVTTNYLFDDYRNQHFIKKKFSDLFEKRAQSLSIQYGFEFLNGRINAVEAPCHQALSTLDHWLNEVPIRYYSGLRCYAADKKAANKYWDMLFRHDSPFRSLFKNLGFYEVEGERKAFYIDVDKDTSTQLLASLSIASRYPYEYNTVMNKLMKLNYATPAEMLFTIATIGDVIEKCVVTRTIYDHGHHAFDYDTDLSMLKNAAPELDTRKILGEYSGYEPCNIIWKNINFAENSADRLTTKSGEVTQPKLFAPLLHSIKQNKSKSIPITEYFDALRK